MRRNSCRATALAFIIVAGVSTVGSSASAQTYPARPIKAITDVGPGGTYDIFARALGEALHKRWGQPVVVEPRPGGNFIIGGRACAESAPDGYTLCVLSRQTLVANEFLYKKIPYSPGSFIPIRSSRVECSRTRAAASRIRCLSPSARPSPASRRRAPPRPAAGGSGNASRTDHPRRSRAAAWPSAGTSPSS